MGTLAEGKNGSSKAWRRKVGTLMAERCDPDEASR
jgi:hypothetical protein